MLGLVWRAALVVGAIILGKQFVNSLSGKKRIDPNKVYSMEEIKDVLGITMENVTALVKAGRLISSRVGETSIVMGKDLLEFLGVN